MTLSYLHRNLRGSKRNCVRLEEPRDPTSAQPHASTPTSLRKLVLEFPARTRSRGTVARCVCCSVCCSVCHEHSHMQVRDTCNFHVIHSICTHMISLLLLCITQGCCKCVAVCCDVLQRVAVCILSART